MAGSGTKRSFARGVSNVRPCQKPTICVCTNGPTYRLHLGPLLSEGFWLEGLKPHVGSWDPAADPLEAEIG